MLEHVKQKGIKTAFDRTASMAPCPIGSAGSCCKICNMGPCRLNPKKPDEGTGICGATASTISARNFARMVAAGAASHCDHGRAVAHTFLLTARGEVSGYQIKDVKKLHSLAAVYGIETSNRTKEQIAEALALAIIEEFGAHDSKLNMPKRAPQPRQELWNKLNVWPRSIDREVVDLMSRTVMGTDQDDRNIYMASARCALANGWGGSMIATELQDILFGTPVPTRGKVNLGVIKKDEVNIIVHGHEPLLSEMIVIASKDKALVELAKSKGAKGITIAGVCCTANELLMRHGIPVAGNFSQQELVLATGAVEAMVVDVQCLMQALTEMAACYHTKIITTSPKAKITGAIHMEFDEHSALATAKEIVKTAIENYPRRGETCIPQEDTELVCGFSHETINYMLGGSFRGSYRPLNDNIMNGRILGVVGVVGCEVPSLNSNQAHYDLITELIANNILVVQSGCSALGSARNGLLLPETAIKLAGKGLAEVCQTVGIPPVLHAGACVDNSRILVAAAAMVQEGGLGKDISDLPVAGACPTWMSEKAIAIGMYFVASGVFTVFGPRLQTMGSKKFEKLLCEDSEQIFKGRWGVSDNPKAMAQMIIDHINNKREKLGINKAKERVLYDMAMRRDLKIE
ncbi:MAG: anaerobic carbon-monoxide dehydrogenase catalytic subunit [Planctomycetes bacterium]|nr:anaerobic carbon-monoxide dehydrogenase catalytic subunit [Planctomycetota bacterium]